MTDKELFALMIKNYSIVLENLQRRKDFKNIEVDKEKNRIKSFSYLRIDQGVKIISILRDLQTIQNYGYFTFDILSDSVIYELIRENVDLYKIDSCSTCSDFVCSIGDIEIVLKNVSSKIYNLHFSHYRIKNNYFPYYSEIIQNNIIQIKSPVMRAFDGYFINGKIGIEKYGVFAYECLYTDFEWTFDMVERYKDSIIWKNLIENSNLRWSEEMILKYIQHIPFSSPAEYYCDKFDNKVTLERFSTFETLSFSFINKNKDNINLPSLFETGHFSLTGNQLIYLYNYLINIEMPYSKSFADTKAGSQLRYRVFENLVKNQNFEWTKDSIIALHECDNLNVLLNLEEHNKKQVYNSILHIPNYKYIFKDKVFIKKLKYGKKYSALISDFTVENIKLNRTRWNEVLSDNYSSIHRLSRDTYYYVYVVKTKWNYFLDDENITLTYDLCKLLYGIDVVIGGTYKKEYQNQEYYDSGFYTTTINGLKCFKNHSIKNENELEKICQDSVLLELFFSKEYRNNEVVDYSINNFFRDYEESNFLQLIEKYK